MRTSISKVLGNDLGRIVAAVGILVLLAATPTRADEATESPEHDAATTQRETCTEQSKRRKAKVLRRLKASSKQLDRLATELEYSGNLDLAGEVQKVREQFDARIRVALAPVTGRYVRVELAGSERVLSLAEVEVFSGGENIAPKGEATQSSTYNHISNPGPRRAVDGNSNGDFSVRSTTHTNQETNPWWELDLGIDQGLYKIAIWNRLGASVRGQLDGFKVSVLDGDREVVWERTFSKAPKRRVAIDLGSAP